MQHTVETIKNKYLGMSKPVKAAFWFTVCSFLQRGISMIATPIFTRLLSTENYGLYSTYLSWETVLMMLVTLSLYKAMMNLYVKYENQEMVLSAVCGLELVLSLTFGCRMVGIISSTCLLPFCKFYFSSSCSMLVVI